MTKKWGTVAKFDAYIKKSLSNRFKDIMKAKKVQRKHTITFSDLSSTEESQLCYEDTYYYEIFSKEITTSKFDAVIHDELLYEALQFLNPSVREIIVLKYWGDFTDRELGEILNMSRRMANYNKNQGIVSLRNIIKEMRKNDTRFKL